MKEIEEKYKANVKIVGQKRYFNCMICNKRTYDVMGTQGFRLQNNDNSEIDIEYHNYCRRCFEKKQSRMNMAYKLVGMVSAGQVDEDTLKKWNDGEISTKEIHSNYLERKKGDSKRKRKEYIDWLRKTPPEDRQLEEKGGE